LPEFPDRFSLQHKCCNIPSNEYVCIRLPRKKIWEKEAVEVFHPVLLLNR